MAASKITHDYYAVLGITQTGDENLIRTSYMRLAKLRHPDKNLANPNATAEFQLLNAAYSTLKEAAKRRDYDTYHYPSVRPKQPANPPPKPATANPPPKPKPTTPNTSNTSNPTPSPFSTTQQYILRLATLDTDLINLRTRQNQLTLPLRTATAALNKTLAALASLATQETQDKNAAANAPTGSAAEIKAAEAEARARRAAERRTGRLVLEARRKSQAAAVARLRAREKLIERDIADIGRLRAETVREMEAMREMEAEREKEERGRAWEERKWEAERERVERVRRERAEKEKAEAQAKAEVEAKRAREKVERERREREEGNIKKSWREREAEKERERKAREELERERERRRVAEQMENLLQRLRELSGEPERKAAAQMEELLQQLMRGEQESGTSDSRKEEADAKEEQPKKQEQGAAKPGLDAKGGKKKKKPGNNNQKAAPSSPSNKPNPAAGGSSCKHKGWWARQDGSHMCSRCQQLTPRVCFQCPGCQMLACAPCRVILKSQ